MSRITDVDLWPFVLELKGKGGWVVVNALTGEQEGGREYKVRKEAEEAARVEKMNLWYESSAW